MRRVLLLGAALMAASLVGAPPDRAAAAAPSPAEAALVPVQTEMMLLVELDAFDAPVPAKVQGVHDEWATYAAGMDRPALLDWLADVDRKGSLALDRLIADVGDPSPQVRLALGALGTQQLVALGRGEHITIGPGAYEKAWFDLDERNGRSLGTDTGTVPTVARAAASSTAPGDPPSTSATTTPASSGPGFSTPLVALLSVVVGGAALATFLKTTRRRRTTPATPPPPDRLTEQAVHDLLDAGQRLAGSLDPTEVERRAVEEAVAVTRAEHGAFVRGRASQRRVGHTTSAGFPTDADLERGVVARALDAGQAARTAGSDRSVSGDRLALLAVPTVHAGTVVGALVVARAAEQPFTPADAESLSRLAPLVATALDAAGRHTDTAELALVDPLTRVGNRRRLERDLPGALGGADPAGLVMVDVDHFKRFNDTFGHQAGDEALALVAAALGANVRDGDVVYRYGGEEFCVLLPGATPDEAFEVAERLRLGVAAATALSWGMDPRRALTVSVGVAVSTDRDGERLVARADHALYAAKRAGRDRVVVAD